MGEKNAYSEETGYFVRDMRSVTGNSAVWWRVGGGYTDNLDHAQVFAESELQTLRDTDVPVPCRDARALSYPVVDVHSLG